MKEKKKLLNDDIQADRVQVITESWDNKWEMSLSDAISLAQKDGLDVMQIWDKWNVAIVKILDYWKFLYQKKKQDQKNKQKGKAPEQKTIRISFKISEHDLEVRKNQAEKFAKAGSPLKVQLMLRGRENHYADMARERMEHFVAMLSDIYDLEKKIMQNGSNFVANLKVKK